MNRNAALIILYDSNRNILLQHRTNDAPAYPGYIGFFGGEIETGENPLEAVKRETIEELNYVLKKPKLVHSCEYENEYYKGKKYYFIEKCLNKRLLRLQEGQAMIWTTFSKARSLKMTEWNKKILEKLELEKNFVI